MIDSNPLRFRVNREPWDAGYKMLMGTENHREGTFSVCTELKFERFDNGMAIPESAGIALTERGAQSLMDELWNAGIRPASGEGSVGQIGATEKHLEDMRKIVSKNLEVEL